MREKFRAREEFGTQQVEFGAQQVHGVGGEPPQGPANAFATEGPASGPIEELAVPWDPGPTLERIQRRRRMLRGRLIGLAVTAALLVGFTVWQWDSVSHRNLLITDAVFFGVGLVGVGVSFWLLHCARRAARSLGTGIALQVGRAGIELVGHVVPWDRLACLDAARARLSLGPRLRLRDTAGVQVVVPWDQLDVWPATLDTVVRAYSAGRHGVDLSGFDV